MAKKEEWVRVGDRRLKLSNLDKILYPENKVRKAEIIHYYLTVAPLILDHSKGRPLTLIRYPDGIGEEQFYQKDKPDWAPEWIHSVRLGDEEKKDYVVPTEKATLVWLANLASLELHQMHVRQPDFDQPDYMVFDLDPADNSDFGKVVEIAYKLKDHLEVFGYPSFIKTSGKKGLHLAVPLVPEAWGDKGAGSRFVIQRHHATRLHYDLRLERNGALQSWAVPKGLPPRPGIKRLAVETEEHPLEYLHFEGDIPKGEYGGGRMWIYARGNYEMMKQKEGSLRFRLESPALSGEYQMYRTEKDQWLIERLDHPEIEWLDGNISPMNARRTREVPAGDYVYEVKWDGIRAMVTLEDEEIKIHSRNLNDVTARFPELQDASALRANCGLFDGEIVYLDEQGKPQFHKIINRLKHSSSPRKESGSVYCYLFDCLYLDGRPIIREPLARRKEWVGDVIKKGAYSASANQSPMEMRF